MESPGWQSSTQQNRESSGSAARSRSIVSASAPCASPARAFEASPRTGRKRAEPRRWEMDGKPEWLRAQAIASCEKLGVKRIDLWQLHRVDPKLPCRIKSLIDDGIIRMPASLRCRLPISRMLPRCSRWRRCRIATIWSIAAARTCSIIANGTASASSRGFRWPPAISPARARCSTRSRRIAPCRVRSLSPGC